MREIEASDAEAAFAQILRDVELGETVRITRRGRPIARIVPEAHCRQEEVDQAIESIKALRSRVRGLTLDEVLSARHEGHRY